ncbi:MAG: putative transcriptional regulator, PucR family [Frankiales bacterium]|jgi:purine catabolism regulator|nr:putative transcriptional regulator, PucR family [Frankiales bacterium]
MLRAVTTRGLQVEELIRSPALQLTVLAGQGGLARTLSWAHVSELEDPTPWLLGAELIMTTGLAVPRSAARQRAYVERLDDAGVAALALSAQLHVPPLHPAFFAAAEERSMPVLQVPLPVPFIAVAQEVAAALQTNVRQRLGAQLQVFGAVRWLAAEDLDVAEVFARLERLSGYTFYLCTPQGRVLLEGTSVPPPHLAALLPASADAPPTVPGGFVLPVPAPGDTAGFLLAQEREGAHPAGLAVVQHVATVAALLLTFRRHEREIRFREGAETLAELLRHVLEPTTARRRLERAGFPPGAPVALCVVRGAGTSPPDAVVEPAVVRAVDEAGAPVLLLRQQDVLYALVPHDPDVLAALGGAADVHVGVSQPFAAGEPLDVPRREALWAVARAVDSGRPVVAYGDDDVTGRWLPGDAGVLAGLVEHVLGAALTYDSRHGSSLVPSVRTWLERDRHTEEAARALGVHANTLSYRLKRFGDITGRDLASTAAMTEVWMALTAARHLGD